MRPPVIKLRRQRPLALRRVLRVDRPVAAADRAFLGIPRQGQGKGMVQKLGRKLRFDMHGKTGIPKARPRGKRKILESTALPANPDLECPGHAP